MKNKIINGTVDPDHTGDDRPLKRGRFHSNRNLRILEGTCRTPGGWRCLPCAGAVHRTHRYARWWIRSHFVIQVSHSMSGLCVLALFYQPYGSRTIITHMRINDINSGTVTWTRLRILFLGMMHSWNSKSTYDREGFCTQLLTDIANPQIDRLRAEMRSACKFFKQF